MSQQGRIIKSFIVLVYYRGAFILILIRVRGMIRSANARRQEGVCQNRVIAKDVKSCIYCCWVRCATSIVWVRGIFWPLTGTTNNFAQLGLPDKGLAIKGFVVCYVVWLGSMKASLGHALGA